MYYNIDSSFVYYIMTFIKYDNNFWLWKTCIDKQTEVFKYLTDEQF